MNRFVEKMEARLREIAGLIVGAKHAERRKLQKERSDLEQKILKARAQ